MIVLGSSKIPGAVQSGDATSPPASPAPRGLVFRAVSISHRLSVYRPNFDLIGIGRYCVRIFTNTDIKEKKNEKNEELEKGLTLIPLGYFEDLSPLGGGGGGGADLAPPPSDLGN